MKNFTKQFKQITSHLSARWFIIAFMLFLGIGNAWATDNVIYITSGTTSGYSNPYIYVWNNSSNNSWPGQPMTSAGKTSEGYPVYKYEWGNNTINTFIVMNGSCGDGCKKTGDVTYSQNKNYVYNVSTKKWSSYNPCTDVTITWNDFQENMCIGDKQALIATASHGNVSFSSNSTNATISGTELTAAKAGSANITASVAASGNYCSATATKTVNIKNCIPVGTVLYLKPSNEWTTDNARYALYLFGEGEVWVSANETCKDPGYYEITVPDGIWTNFIWCRMNPSNSANNWDNEWNQTADLTFDGSKNLYTVTDWGNGEFSSWTAKSCCVSLTAPTLTATNVVKCGDNYTDGKITISGYDANTYIYELKNSSGQTVSKTYSNGYTFSKDEVGTYKVIMKRMDNTQCEPVTTAEEKIEITDNTPTITKFSVSASSESVCSGTKITLTATHINGASYEWFLNNSQTPISGATSYLYEPTITANATYKVVVTKTSNDCPASKDASVSIIAKPVPTTSDFDITLPSNATYNGNAYYASVAAKSDISGIGAITTKYYDSNGNDVENPTNADTYTVKISVAAGDSYCAMAETEIGEFTINKAKQTTPTITAESTDICGKEATFTVSGGESTGDYVYSFDKNDADVTIDGTTLKATQSGSVTLKVKKAQDANYNESAEVTKEFNFTMPIENVKLTKADSKTTYCTGDVVRIKLTYDGPTVTDINKFKWNGAVEGQVSIANVTGGMASGVEFDVTCISGENEISVALTDCSGEKPSNPLEINVNPLPSAPELTNPDAICFGEKITLPETDNKGKTIKWVDVDNRELTGLSVGTHTYTAKIEENGCESATTTYTITVKEQLAKPELTVTNVIQCGTTYTAGKIVISNYNAANTYILKKDGTPITKDYNEGYAISETETGEYTVEVSKDGACGATSDAKSIGITNNTPTVNPFGITLQNNACEGNPLTLSYDGTQQSGTVSYAWYEGENREVLGTENTFTIQQAKNATYKLVVTVTSNSCPANGEAEITVAPKAVPAAPTFDPYEMSACVGERFELPMPNNVEKEVEGQETLVLWTVDGQATPRGQTQTTAGDYTYTAYINDGCPSQGTPFTVHVNPLPTISIAADLETVNVGDVVTLTATGENIASIVWSATDGTKDYTVTSTSATTATITSEENAIITVTAVATSENGCVATATKEITFGREDCLTSSADYIEILCRRTNNPESADADRDMHCYAWITGSTSTLLGGWPGVVTENGNFEYKGKKYAVWHIKSDADVSIVFSNANDNQKTGDIPGHVKGYRYVYTLSSDYKTATLYEEPSLINMPEVRTVSVTSERQANGDLKVYMSGKILKKGCAPIKSYGFQYKKDNGDYTGTAGIVENTDQDAGYVFTAETTLTKGNYGEYTFRARLINENSTKVYGEEFKIYFYESDVFIEAVGGDKQVTNKSGVYYDFVGLYVKNVTVPAGVSISRYKWFKGGVEYNDGNATVADRGVSSSSNNIRPNEAGTYTCEVTLSNGEILESNEIVVSATNTYSEVVTSANRNLPVISVRTNEAFPTCETAGTTGKYPSTNIEGWKEKRSVDVKIFDANGTLYYDRKARMNYRGSSSLNFNKKSYAFCPGEENCGQEKDKTPDYVTTTEMNLFGLSNGAEDKDWVLYAAAADPTLMRNRLVFDTYKAMRGSGTWGVDSKYVELIIDGVYQGVYVLMDKITKNKKRVDITASDGFIVKFDKTDIADREADLLNAGQEVGDEKTFLTKRTGRVGIQTYHTFVDQLFEIEYPEKKKVVKNGGDWSTTLSAIKQKFEEFETALADGDYIKVRSLIDYESWADWFIINEFTKNVDAYRASCVFVYNGNKIEAQPLWDQELSFNNAAGANIGKKGADKTTGLLIENNGVYTDCFPAPFWWTGTKSNFNNCDIDGGESTVSSEKIQNYLLKDECFVATIKYRWEDHTKEGGALHKTQLTKKYSALVTELGAAKDREIAKWPSNHRVADACGGPGTGYNNVTFDASAKALEAWIDQDLVEISSESESASRASNLNYLIENMEGEPLRFDLTLNPASGVTTPWIPITVIVEVPDGYEYTYDDSSIKANEGVIIKSTTDKHSYTFSRPENWNTGNQGEGNEIEPLFYDVNVSLNIETTETASCGESEFETSKTVIISLQDEGDDLCNYAD